jgi:hypothetical protein
MEQRIYPSHLQIETVNGLCDARCTMCVIFDDGRPKEIMPLDLFKRIADRFSPYVQNFKFVTLHGCGEPLLDKTISDKVKYMKEMGFVGVGFSSNCQKLTRKTSEKLLDAGMDTLIASVDGASKEVHEGIRKRTKFDVVVNNIETYLQLRNLKGNKGRVIVRFIRQQSNAHEWDAYRAFWEARIDKSKGDAVIKFDIHNCGSRIGLYESMKIQDAEVVEPCIDLWERIIVFASGAYAFCSADQSGYFDLGNAMTTDPVDAFNSDIFKRYRERMIANDWQALDHCRSCTIPLSRQFKDRVATKPLVEQRPMTFFPNA